MPGALLAEKFGGKHTLGFGMISTAICTLLVPYAVENHGSKALIALRVLMGLGQGVVFPSMNVLVAHWAPPSEVSSMMSVIFEGIDVGIILTTSVSGLILRYSAIGWPMVFYVIGGFGVIWYILWLGLVYNEPNDHPLISEKELNFMKDAMADYKLKKALPVPWKRIFKSPAFWALLAAQIGHDWGLNALINYLPKYMNSVLKYPSHLNGFLSSLPNLIGCIYALIMSWITDKLISSNKVTKTNARKINTSIALIGPAIFLVSASFAGCNRILVVLCFVFGVTLMSSALPGIQVNPLDLSPNYAGTLMALTNGIASLTGTAAPYLIGVLIPNHSLTEWRTVFFILAFIFLSTNTVFLLFGSGEVQEWNNLEDTKRVTEIQSSSKEEYNDVVEELNNIDRVK